MPQKFLCSLLFCQRNSDWKKLQFTILNDFWWNSGWKSRYIRILQGFRSEKMPDLLNRCWYNIFFPICITDQDYYCLHPSLDYLINEGSRLLFSQICYPLLSFFIYMINKILPTSSFIFSSTLVRCIDEKKTSPFRSNSQIDTFIKTAIYDVMVLV